MKALQKAIDIANRRGLNNQNDDDQVKRMFEIANKTKGYHVMPGWDMYSLCSDFERLVTAIDKYGYWSDEVRYFNDILMGKGGYDYMSDLNKEAKEMLRSENKLERYK